MDSLAIRSESFTSSASHDTMGAQDELQDVYLSELLSYSLDRLNKEPELLRADAERVRRQMQEVAVEHYRAFITAAEAVQSIRQETAAVDQHLDKLISEIPKLTAGCSEFLDQAQLIVEKRRLNRTMLANHPTLVELLEIPQLMDTCVRNGNYDEALELEAFVSKLATMHSKLPVIQSLAGDVRVTTQAMLQQLLHRLRSNIQLPECLRVIAYLRRLAVFSEHDMRLQFLRCREAWLADVIDDLDQSNPYDYLKRMTDCHRVQLFDVVTQYRAIFADDSSNQEDSADGGLLYSWAMHRVSSYLAVLGSTLPKITDGGSLASVLEHCMYCGMSLGRVGLDFRGLLPPLFELCVQSLFVTNISLAVETFQHVLDLHRWVPLPSMGSSGRSSTGDDLTEDVAPPYSLMEHPPLAAFVNGVLATLNQLRHCAPTSLRSTLGNQVQLALNSVGDILLRYHETRIVRDSEMSLFLAMCRAFIEVVCPYCAFCFGRCYPGGGNLVDIRVVVEPVRRLVLASIPPPEENGGEEEAVDDGEEGGEGGGEGGEGGERGPEGGETEAEAKGSEVDDLVSGEPAFDGRGREEGEEATGSRELSRGEEGKKRYDSTGEKDTTVSVENGHKKPGPEGSPSQVSSQGTLKGVTALKGKEEGEGGGQSQGREGGGKELPLPPRFVQASSGR